MRNSRIEQAPRNKMAGRLFDGERSLRVSSRRKIVELEPGFDAGRADPLTETPARPTGTAAFFATCDIVGWSFAILKFGVWKMSRSFE
jgi:hypothetical protein